MENIIPTRAYGKSTYAAYYDAVWGLFAVQARAFRRRCKNHVRRWNRYEVRRY